MGRREQDASGYVEDYFEVPFGREEARNDYPHGQYEGENARHLLWDKPRGRLIRRPAGSTGAADPAESDPGARACQPDQYDQCR